MSNSPYLMVGTRYMEFFPGDVVASHPTHPQSIRDRFGNVIVTGDIDVAGPGGGDPVLPIRTNLNLKAAAAIEADDVVTLGTGSGTLGDYLRKDGTIPLTGDWNIGAGRKIELGLLSYRPAVAIFEFQDAVGGALLSLTGVAGASTVVCNLGDVDLAGNSTVLTVDDNLSTITLSSSIISLGKAAGSGVSVLDDLTMADTKTIATDQVRARDGDGLKLYDDGGFGIFVEDGGHVGIGTSSPIKDVHISSPIPTIRLSDSSAVTDQAVATLIELYRGDNTNRVGFWGMASYSSDTMVLATDYPAGEISFRTGSNVDRLLIDSSGKVGVGTVTPSAALNIVGDNSRLRVENAARDKGLNLGHRTSDDAGLIAALGTSEIILRVGGADILTAGSGGHIGITTSATLGKEALNIIQTDADKAFINFQGTFDNTDPPSSGNLTTLNSGGDSSAVAVAGPKASYWVHVGMIRIEVDGVADDYFIPYYKIP